jgi:hypothetical protein
MTFIAAFITGHSVPGCTGLSSQQRDFQRATGITAERWIPYNFPWVETWPFPEPVPLIEASISNVRHYLASRRKAFTLAHRDSVSQLLAPHDKILLLAGSCGLELFNNLELPPVLRQRIHLFAYGPVSRKTPEVASYCLVQGQRDWLSRVHHSRVHHRFACRHLEYLRTPQTLRAFLDFHQRVLRA